MKQRPHSTGAFVYVEQPQETLGRKLFPRTLHVDPPKVPWGKDVVIVRTTTSFSFIERLRILFGGRVEVVTKTATRIVVNKHETTAQVNIVPPKCLCRKEVAP